MFGFCSGNEENLISLSPPPPPKTCLFWKRTGKTENLPHAEQEPHPFDILASSTVVLPLVIKIPRSLFSFEIPRVRSGWAAASRPDTPGTWRPPARVRNCPEQSGTSLWARLLLGQSTARRHVLLMAGPAGGPSTAAGPCELLPWADGERGAFPPSYKSLATSGTEEGKRKQVLKT